jgi:hypothetical protein
MSKKSKKKKSKIRIKKILRNTKKVKKQIGGMNPPPTIIITDAERQEIFTLPQQELIKYQIDRHKHIHQANQLILTQNSLLCHNAITLMYKTPGFDTWRRNNPTEHDAFKKAYSRPEEIRDGYIELTINVAENAGDQPVQQLVIVNIENILSNNLNPGQKIALIFKTYYTQTKEPKICMIVDIGGRYYLCIGDFEKQGLIFLERIKVHGTRNYCFKLNNTQDSPDIQELVNKFLPSNVGTTAPDLIVPLQNSDASGDTEEIQLKDYIPIPEGFLNRRS